MNNKKKKKSDSFLVIFHSPLYLHSHAQVCVSRLSKRGKRNERSGENTYGSLAFFRFQIVKREDHLGCLSHGQTTGKN